MLWVLTVPLPALRGQRQGTLSPGPLRFFWKKIE